MGDKSISLIFYQWAFLCCNAAEPRYEAIAKLLVEKGAGLSVQNNGGETPLHFASQNGDESIAKLLVEKGAELNSGRITPLDWATWMGRKAIAKMLVEKGAVLSVRDTLVEMEEVD
jgi:ankyrin repeat protein